MYLTAACGAISGSRGVTARPSIVSAWFSPLPPCIMQGKCIESAPLPHAHAPLALLPGEHRPPPARAGDALFLCQELPSGESNREEEKPSVGPCTGAATAGTSLLHLNCSLVAKEGISKALSKTPKTSNEG